MTTLDLGQLSSDQSFWDILRNYLDSQQVVKVFFTT